MEIAIKLPDPSEYAGLTSVDELSPRERSVLTLIAAGYSNQDICDELFVSINSVKTYVRTAYRKVGIESRPQAILWGIRNGLVDLDDLMGRRTPDPQLASVA